MIKTAIVLLLVILLVSGLEAKNDAPENLDFQQLEEIEEQTAKQRDNMEIIEEAAFPEGEEWSDDVIVDGELEGSGSQETGDTWDDPGDIVIQPEEEGASGVSEVEEEEDLFEGSGSAVEEEEDFEESEASGEAEDEVIQADENEDEDESEFIDSDQNGIEDELNNEPSVINEKRYVDVDLALRIPILRRLLSRKHIFAPLANYD
ncbi:glutamic acid-rich protein-like [Agrilus planipennis]|uniref:Glutamic acid-rich protein-like n=1 Tax=Agrilus planipennis TaxID=224129 RepID=A0A1W4WC88_AGRPL|nr:glutamic acid-rich protein-like [Agrilus planipennis]